MSTRMILNPNTRQALTQALLVQVQTQVRELAVPAPGGDTWVALTAPHGADYIATEATYVVAARAALDAWHLHTGPRPQAILVACFGDPGVWALRELSGVPVMGLAEAAFREAQALGPFGVVTGGAAWGPMLMRLSRSLQCAGPTGLVAVQTIEASGGELAAAPQAAWDALAEATIALLQAQPGLRSVILGGAVLGGWVPPVRERLLAAQADGRLPAGALPPLIDSVEAGARWLARATA